MISGSHIIKQSLTDDVCHILTFLACYINHHWNVISVITEMLNHIALLLSLLSACLRPSGHMNTSTHRYTHAQTCRYMHLLLHKVININQSWWFYNWFTQFVIYLMQSYILRLSLPTGYGKSMIFVISLPLLFDWCFRPQLTAIPANHENYSYM